jgi:hypothetical protein
MPQKNKPAEKKPVPDPARSYERARPEDEAGMGRLETNPFVPEKRADKVDQAVPNRQSASQINAHDVVGQQSTVIPPGDPEDEDQSSPINSHHKTRKPKTK